MPFVKFFVWIGVFVFGLSLSYFVPYVENWKISFFEPESMAFVEGTILFGGDVMLGRSVERIANENGGYSFPFKYIKETVEKRDLAIVNFESSIPKVHVPTQPLTMKFSVPEAALLEVKNSGFDIVSLSNNHSFDYGEVGYIATKASCERVGITCIGHSFKHSTSSMTVQKVGDTTIGILALHTLFAEPSTTELSLLIQELNNKSDIQFVYIHWGEEYIPVHNTPQEELAHFFIEEGIDAVVGHHPHVEQDIELYMGKPIFYSLGNLIFDQFFSEEVQKGYMVDARVSKEAVSYTLLPYELKTERTQPRFEKGEMLIKRINSLMPKSLFSKEDIERGSFDIQRD